MDLFAGIRFDWRRDDNTGLYVGLGNDKQPAFQAWQSTFQQRYCPEVKQGAIEFTRRWGASYNAALLAWHESGHKTAVVQHLIGNTVLKNQLQPIDDQVGTPDAGHRCRLRFVDPTVVDVPPPPPQTNVDRHLMASQEHAAAAVAHAHEEVASVIESAAAIDAARAVADQRAQQLVDAQQQLVVTQQKLIETQQKAADALQRAARLEATLEEKLAEKLAERLAEIEKDAAPATSQKRKAVDPAVEEPVQKKRRSARRTAKLAK